MEIGLYLRSFMSDPVKPLHEQFDDVVEICKAADQAGFKLISVPQHWVSHPTVWPDTFTTLARLAPETGAMKLLTGILLLPLHNPIQIAESSATLDHISKGRFILGVGNGYREAELEAVGATRRDRVPRLVESIDIMKKLWSGEEVSYEGKYWNIQSVRMGFTPLQKPNPPIWIACQSDGAARRAARIADAIYVAPQVGISDIKSLVDTYVSERGVLNRDGKGTGALSRGISFASNKEQALREARDTAESSYRTYSRWNMQEDSMVRIHIDAESDVSQWAIAGSPEDCVEQLSALKEGANVETIVTTILNLPKGLEARKEYLQKFSERVIQRVV